MRHPLRRSEMTQTTTDPYPGIAPPPGADHVGKAARLIRTILLVIAFAAATGFVTWFVLSFLGGFFGIGGTTLPRGPVAHYETAGPQEDEPGWSCSVDGTRICAPGNPQGAAAGCYDQHGVLVKPWPCPGGVTGAASFGPQEDEPGWDCVSDGDHRCGPANTNGVPAGCYGDGGMLLAVWPCHLVVNLDGTSDYSWGLA
jgi:hypothetical protein